MPYRTGSRKRSFDQQFDWNAEKAASEVHPPERRPYVRVNESLAGSSIMTCCGEYRCVCVCPACGEPSVTGMTCDVCQLEHDIKVQREQEESFQMTELALAQLRMAGLL